MLHGWEFIILWAACGLAPPLLSIWRVGTILRWLAFAAFCLIGSVLVGVVGFVWLGLAFDADRMSLDLAGDTGAYVLKYGLIPMACMGLGSLLASVFAHKG